MCKLLWSAQDGLVGGAVQFCGSFGRDDSDCWGDGTAGQRKVDARSGNRVDDDGRVREKSGESKAQAVRVCEGVCWQEGIGRIKALCRG